MRAAKYQLFVMRSDVPNVGIVNVRGLTGTNELPRPRCRSEAIEPGSERSAQLLKLVRGVFTFCSRFIDK